MNFKWLGIGFLFILFAFGLFPYIMIFHNSTISRLNSDWGNFGSYLSGICEIINVFVLVYITYLVNKLDNERNRNQIESQFKITLTQFRQNELNNLSLKLDSVFENNGTEETIHILYKITSTGKYLSDFANQKKYLFPIIESPEIVNIIEIIQSRYDQFIPIIEELHGNDCIENWQESKMMTKIQLVINQKTILIDELQKFILRELKT